MHSVQKVHGQLHHVSKYIGGVSLQNHEIHNPGVTREPSMAAICKTETTSFA